MSHNGKALYEFSDFRLDIPERLLIRKGKRVWLSEKAFQTLCVLVEKAGHLVPKDELMSRVWPDSIVEENNLDKSVSTLRHALGENQKNKGKFIETVRGRGYRFVATVQCVSPDLPEPVTPIGDNQETAGSDVSSKNRAFPKQGIIVFASILLLAIFAFLLFVVKDSRQHGSSASKGTLPSVAVIPFVNLSKDQDQDYFVDGLAEDILNALSKNPNLRVVARTSAFGFKETNDDLSRIGNKLNVANILKGSLRKQGNQLRVTVQLVRVQDGASVWSETYDRELENVFEIQSDIATQIALALDAELSPSEKAKIRMKPTSNVTAYDYYLKGREYYLRRRNDDNERAIELFRKALEVDPNFALAYTGLGDAYHKRTYLFGFPESWLDESIEACRKAIAIDPELSEAYVVLSKSYNSKRQITKAQEASKKALALNPNSSNALSMHSYYLIRTGELEEALQWAVKVVAIDPTSSWAYYNVASIYFMLADLDQAKLWLKNSLNLQPDFTFALHLLSTIAITEGKYAEAGEFATKAISIDPGPLNLVLRGRIELYSANYEKAEEYYRKANLAEVAEWNQSWIQFGFILQKLGRLKDAEEMFDRIRKRIQAYEALDNNDLYCLATISAIEGNKQEAYMWLRKSIDAGNVTGHTMMRDPLLESLRSDPEFLEMMHSLKTRIDEIRTRLALKS
jgi:TolB-like protein/DNA-binding winged helix-turn-helix (wHTH) protein/lipopolysaccharide biosynthesis regulator YciM